MIVYRVDVLLENGKWVTAYRGFDKEVADSTYMLQAGRTRAYLKSARIEWSLVDDHSMSSAEATILTNHLRLMDLL